jgi:MFS family permease
MFVIGAILFGIGSLIASLSTNVGTLVLGEAFIEGVGASLMLPASIGILSSTFSGAERGTAFAAWGTTLGASVAFGPLLGGFLTTHYSWRWAFRINVIVVPFAVLGAMLFMRRVEPTARHARIDIPGSLLISTGMLALVFSISDGATYGWWHARQTFAIAGITVWPHTRPISIIPLTFLLAIGLLSAFWRLEVAKERADADPLFEFGQLEIATFRYGLSTLLLLAMAQISFLFVMSVFLQDGLHRSAVTTGVWLMPSGVFIVIGSQIGARLTRTIGTHVVVRLGLTLEAIGLTVIGFTVTPTATFPRFLVGFACYGIGIGFAAAQLTNVVLSEIAPDKSGAASGANTTVRMIGSSLGIAVISAILVSADATDARRALLFGAGVAAVGACVSLQIPPLKQ